MVAAKVLEYNKFMFNGKLVNVSDTDISIHAEYIGTKFDIYDRDLLTDVFTQHWKGQKITVFAEDGEPIGQLGLVSFVDSLCNNLDIPRNLVTFISHNDQKIPGFKSQILDLSIFWRAKYHMHPAIDSESHRADLDAKFVGLSVGRYSPPRLRMMYALDQAFAGNCFIIFQRPPDFDNHQMQSWADLYTQEHAWLTTYTFDKDPSRTSIITDWQSSYSDYHNIWKKYQIEIVCETHADSNYWLTEKTGRCLAAGKPFLLLAGTGSLKRLHNMGFKTFNDVIDESYDRASCWTTRIVKMINSLKELHNRSDCNNAIDSLYSIAQYNKLVYLKRA